MLHTKNTAHHLLTIMVGTRNTPDEAYRVLYFELEDRKRAHDTAMAQRKRNQAKRQRLEAQLSDCTDGILRLELEADWLELESNERTMENAILGCEQEMAFIREIMNRLEPQRKYGHLPLGDAFQACQSEEWALEYLKRTKHFLLTTGTIPTDHLDVMVVHPMFESAIAPAIEDFRMKLLEHKVGLHCLPELEPPPFMQQLRQDFALLLPTTSEQAKAQLEVSKDAGMPKLLLVSGKED